MPSILDGPTGPAAPLRQTVTGSSRKCCAATLELNGRETVSSLTQSDPVSAQADDFPVVSSQTT
jgi:hypothetical protein